MNINTSNTASRLNVLEAIAKRQREVCNYIRLRKETLSPISFKGCKQIFEKVL